MNKVYCYCCRLEEHSQTDDHYKTMEQTDRFPIPVGAGVGGGGSAFCVCGCNSYFSVALLIIIFHLPDCFYLKKKKKSLAKMGNCCELKITLFQECCSMSETVVFTGTDTT